MINRRGFLAGAGALCSATPVLAEPKRGFFHGVASGDPQADRVILWSRISGFDGTVSASVEVSKTPDFASLVKRSVVSTDASRDFTLKTDMTGLTPGTVFYYRFTVNEYRSPIGRTRTLPAVSVENVKLAVVSCSNFPAGFFNVYRTIGHHNDLDAVVHLGDYLYEYPVDGYASQRSKEFGRQSVPTHEVTVLADYRTRYAQYRSDPDLRYVHERHPFICIWDDHEISNDAWTDGAQNHNEGEGSYALRKAAALQAFYEWLPVREPDDRPLEAAWREFQFGEIATLAMIETRLMARSKPLDYSHDLPSAKNWYTKGSRGRYQPTDAKFAATDAAAVSLDQVFDLQQQQSIQDYAELKRLNELAALPAGFTRLPDTERFMRELYPGPERRLLGDRQLDWLQATLSQSKSASTAWQVIGNQTLLSPLKAPDLTRAMSAAEIEALPRYVRGLIPLSQYGLPLNLDSWDGYDAERNRFYDSFEGSPNTLVLTGDTHNAWAADILDARYNRRLGLELATPSVSSPGIAETLKLQPARIEALFKQANPHFEVLDLGHRGYVLLNLDKRSARADYRYVNRIDSPQFTVATGHQVRRSRA